MNATQLESALAILLTRRNVPAWRQITRALIAQTIIALRDGRKG